MEFDAVVRGGTLVRPGRGLFQGDIGIRDGRIAAVTAPGLGLKGRETVDATGKHVFPGIIDTHTHVGIGNGLADLDTDSRAAALGGVTCFMLFLREPVPYGPVFQRAREAGDATSWVDYGFHATLLTAEHLAEVPLYVNELGIKSFKFYMTYRGDDARMRTFDLQMAQAPGVDDGFMYAAFAAVAKHPGALVMVHCENIELIRRLKQQLQAAGEDSLATWNASRPPLAEVEAVERAMRFAAATGATIQVLHMTTGDALASVNRFRGRCPHIRIEVCHPYLLLDETMFTDHRGKMRPPLRPPQHREALWAGVRDGSVDSIGTDHVPRPLSAKLGSYWSLASGAPGTHLLLPAMLTEGYHRRGLPLERLAEAMSLRPAQVYGLYPRKGSLEVGTDADLTVVDLNLERQVQAADFPDAGGWTPYEGMTFKGWPVLTVVRGRKVMQGGELCGAGGWGKYQAR